MVADRIAATVPVPFPAAAGRRDLPARNPGGRRRTLAWRPAEPWRLSGGLPAATSPPGLEILPAAQRRALARAFRDLLPVDTGVERHLRAVLADLLDHPGSLARAQLALAVQRALGVPPRRARALAVAIEYFHTASLVFDDLPAMDDAAERRGRPCPHTVQGEAAAILGALALITRGYALLWQALSPLPVRRRRAASALVDDCLGVAGILDGQARDVHFGTGAGPEAVLRVAAGKTVPLVRLALVLPALAGGAGAAERAALERLAGAWGLAYQALDDCKDRLSTAGETGKSTARDGALGRPNLPLAAGWNGTLARLDGLLSAGREGLAELAAAGPAGVRLARRLGRLQVHLEAEANAVGRRRDVRSA